MPRISTSLGKFLSAHDFVVTRLVNGERAVAWPAVRLIEAGKDSLPDLRISACDTAPENTAIAFACQVVPNV
jgi:hypothetical protein